MLTHRHRPGSRQGAEQHRQQLLAAGAGEPGKPDHLTGVSLEVDPGEHRAAEVARYEDTIAPPAAHRADGPEHSGSEHQIDQLVLVQRRGVERPDLEAVAKHGHAAGDREDLVEPVRDVEDAQPLLLDIADRREQVLDLGPRQRRGRLVEHQDLRRLVGVPEGASDRDHRSLRGRQVADGAPDVDVVEAEGGEHAAGARALGRPADPSAPAGGEPATERKVLDQIQRVDEGQVLMDEPEARLARGGGGPEADLLASDDHRRAVLGAVESGQQLDQGRLARPVLPDQGMDLARRDVEIDREQGASARERLREVRDLEDRGHPDTSSGRGVGAGVVSTGAALRRSFTASGRLANATAMISAAPSNSGWLQTAPLLELSARP